MYEFRLCCSWSDVYQIRSSRQAQIKLNNSPGICRISSNYHAVGEVDEQFVHVATFF